MRYVLKPNFRALGPKLGKKVQLAKAALAKADAAALRADLAASGKTSIDLEGERFELGPEEIEIVVEAAEGFAAAGGKAGVVVLHVALTDALRTRAWPAKSSPACRPPARISTSASPRRSASPSTAASAPAAWPRAPARPSPKSHWPPRW